MDDKEFEEWLDRNEEFQQEQDAFERRRENTKRILDATPSVERSRVIDFVLKRVEKDRKRGISADGSIARLAEDAEEFRDL
jgi:hypothetical protein